MNDRLLFFFLGVGAAVVAYWIVLILLTKAGINI